MKAVRDIRSTETNAAAMVAGLRTFNAGAKDRDSLTEQDLQSLRAIQSDVQDWIDTLPTRLIGIEVLPFRIREIEAALEAYALMQTGTDDRYIGEILVQTPAIQWGPVRTAILAKGAFIADAIEQTESELVAAQSRREASQIEQQELLRTFLKRDPISASLANALFEAWEEAQAQTDKRYAADKANESTAHLVPAGNFQAVFLIRDALQMRMDISTPRFIAVSAHELHAVLTRSGQKGKAVA